jgi:hypothetical protein
MFYSINIQISSRNEEKSSGEHAKNQKQNLFKRSKSELIFVDRKRLRSLFKNFYVDNSSGVGIESRKSSESVFRDAVR